MLLWPSLGKSMRCAYHQNLHFPHSSNPSQAHHYDPDPFLPHFSPILNSVATPQLGGWLSTRELPHSTYLYRWTTPTASFLTLHHCEDSSRFGGPAVRECVLPALPEVPLCSSEGALDPQRGHFVSITWCLKIIESLIRDWDGGSLQGGGLETEVDTAGEVHRHVGGSSGRRVKHKAAIHEKLDRPEKHDRLERFERLGHNGHKEKLKAEPGAGLGSQVGPIPARLDEMRHPEMRHPVMTMERHQHGNGPSAPKAEAFTKPEAFPVKAERHYNGNEESYPSALPPLGSGTLHFHPIINMLLI